MNTVCSHEQRPGANLLDHSFLAASARDSIFSLLILTMLLVYSMGNLLLLSFPAFIVSSKLLIVSICCAIILYSLASASKGIIGASLFLYLLLVVPIYTRLSSWHGLFWVFFAGSAILAVRKRGLIAKLPIAQHLWASLLSAVAIVGSQDYTTFDLFQRVGSGNVHQDTLFHVSIASMLKHHGVVSTGLHGLVETPYHALSHALFASLSRLSSVSTLDVYGSAAQILFAPLLVFFLTCSVKDLDRFDQVSPPLCWSLVSALLVVVPALLSRWCFWDSYFGSESYLVSLGIFALALMPLFRAVITPFYLFSLPVLVYLMTSAKASVGALYVLLWFVRLVFLRSKPFERSLLMVVLVSIAAYMGLGASANANSEAVSFGPLHFVRVYSFWGESITSSAKALLANSMPSPSVIVKSIVALTSFLVLHYLPSWIVILREARALGLKRLLFAPAPLYVAAATAAGLFFGLLFEIPGGSAYYFTNISFFVCIPFLVIYLSKVLIGFSLKGVRVRAIAFALVLALSIPGMAKASIASSVHRHSEVSNSFIDSLVRIRDSSTPSSVYIARSKDLLANPVDRCTAKPFVYPAVSERAWLSVIPPDPNCFYQYYGYRNYGISAAGQAPSIGPVIPQGSKVIKWGISN